MPEQRVGRYALSVKIASGGMAAVYLGRVVGDAGFTRAVAIKKMHPHLADIPQFVAMFLDEARLAARVRHPNVVPTLDVVSSGEELLLVMEYVHGDTLAGLLAAGARAPVPIATRIAADVAWGLSAAHQACDEQGMPMPIVHRDVSPQNVLVGADGVARVLDFGIAKAAGGLHTTSEGQLRGKLRYMAPEQARGERVTPQTDVYGLAVVLWEALTRRRLFDGDNDAAILGKVLEGVVSPPSRHAREVPPELDALVMRGLAREPEDRFASAEEMASELERLPMATRSDVRQWVESTAGEKLRERAEQVARLEASGALATPFPTAGRISVRPPAPAHDTTAATMSLPEAGATIVEERQVPVFGRRNVALLAATAVFVVGAIALTATLRMSRADPPAPATTPAATSAPARTSSPIPTTPPPAATPSDDPGPTISVNDLPRSSASAAPPPPPAPSRPRTPPATTVRSGPDCSSLYYVDAEGIRRVKKECL